MAIEGTILDFLECCRCRIERMLPIAALAVILGTMSPADGATVTGIVTDSSRKPIEECALIIPVAETSASIP
jgi:hypothetical protein